MKAAGRPRREASARDGRLALLLRAYRMQAGLSRQETARRATISLNTLMAFEQGRTHDPGFFKIAALCNVLGITLDELNGSVAPAASNVRKGIMTNGIVSIGYEGRTIEAFVSSLVAAGVSTVADVRLTPLSRKPGFSKTRLTGALTDAGIGYVHMKPLGNPKANREPFWSGRIEEGRSVFRALLDSEPAVEALRALGDLAAEEVVAVLCFEHEQGNCHRHVVIDEVQKQKPVPVLALP